MQKKILVAMSGGVDSSVAALLLKKNGHDVAGITMCLQKAISHGAHTHSFASKSVSDAALVCEHLGIKHFSVDFSQHLQRHVIDNFISEYRRGRTPNPCVQCNRHIKFGLLLAKAEELGYGYFATGHYAATTTFQGRTVIKKSYDSRKDQSYFLYAIQNEVLERIVFPLAALTKKDIRTISQEAALPVAEKPESQDICFIPDGDYHTFFSNHMVDSQPGDIVDTSGTVRGRHQGIPFYTIGQRSGLGIAAPAPLYVLALDAATNRIVVGDKSQVRSRHLVARQVVCHVPHLPQRGLAKIRYAHKPAACTCTLTGDSLDLMFDESQEAITPGQSVVFYDSDMLLCGGIIEEVCHDA